MVVYAKGVRKVEEARIFLKTRDNGQEVIKKKLVNILVNGWNSITTLSNIGAPSLLLC